MTAPDFRTHSRSFPCPHHGPSCKVIGSRGLLLTFTCGRVTHLDALPKRRA